MGLLHPSQQAGWGPRFAPCWYRARFQRSGRGATWTCSSGRISFCGVRCLFLRGEVEGEVFGGGGAVAGGFFEGYVAGGVFFWDLPWGGWGGGGGGGGRALT